jgi:hypothetical protein
MQIAESRDAAKAIVEEFELADYDAEFDYYQALVGDERFAAACYLYQEAGVYATGEHATQADRDARDALERSIKEHAQRVRGQVEPDADQEAADG